MSYTQGDFDDDRLAGMQSAKKANPQRARNPLVALVASLYAAGDSYITGLVDRRAAELRAGRVPKASKYVPHQGTRECERRRRQLQRAGKL